LVHGTPEIPSKKLPHPKIVDRPKTSTESHDDENPVQQPPTDSRWLIGELVPAAAASLLAAIVVVIVAVAVDAGVDAGAARAKRRSGNP
jgi:hypothetical protein